MSKSPDYHDLQNRYVRYLQNFDTCEDPWIDLYCETYPGDSNNDDVWNACYAYTVLIHPDQVDLVLEPPSWEFNYIATPSSFQVITDAAGERRSQKPVSNVVEIFDHADNIDTDIGQRIVVFQTYHEIRPPGMPELSEDFRIYHNLWVSFDRSEAYKINQRDGTDELVARISSTRISVRTKLLRQYLSGRQLCLMKYVDARALAPLSQNHRIPDSTILQPGKYHIERSGSDDSPSLPQSSCEQSAYYSRILGKTVMHPNGPEESGLYPYYDPYDRTRPGQGYKEFIVGEQNDGSPVKFTCNPKMLSNFYGINPKAPHYLTPVYFDKAVLDKYESDHRYLIGPSSVKCGNLWLFRLDNDHTDYVMAWLGDIGTDLPPTEANHWLQYNILPSDAGVRGLTGMKFPQGIDVPSQFFNQEIDDAEMRGISDMAFRRDFLNSFAEPSTPEHLFALRYETLKNQWKQYHGWTLYDNLHDHDRYALSIRLPRDDQDIEERDHQISRIQKLLIEYINSKSIYEALCEDSKTTKGQSIMLLDAFLKEQGYIHRGRCVEFLKDLQKWRSKTVHKKTPSYDQLIEGAEPSNHARRFVEQMLRNAISMLDDLIDFIQ